MAYHEATKHSVASIRAEPHYLDWENRPLPYKIYEADLERRPLVLPRDSAGVTALRAVIQPPALDRTMPVDAGVVARLLHFSLGVVKRRTLGDGSTYDFRAAACTGALYHIDGYVVCGAIGDLAAGVYHFGPHDFSLRTLRAGDHRGLVAAASGDEPSVREAPLLVVFVSTYWRNAWKYRRRAYRHVFWDTGVILAQFLALAAANRLPARLVTGFVDRDVENLLGLDPTREGAVAIVALGSGSAAPPALPAQPVGFATRPLSREEIDFPMIPETHRATSLLDASAVRAWHAAARELSPGEEQPRGEMVKLGAGVYRAERGGPGASEARSSRSEGALDGPPESMDLLEAVILRRGSSRRFARRPISLAALGSLLRAASAPLSADYRREPADPLFDLFVIVNAVEELEPGAYRWYPREGGLERISAGERRRDAGMLALGQALGADAAANVYAIADLDRVLGALGERGYRAASLDGGISGGRTYLAAYAQRFGATGLTFFDDDVARFFGLDACRFGVTFLTAVGIPGRS